MKINFSMPKIVKRYYKKNTISARYNRQLDKANISSLLFIGEGLRFPQWSTADIGIFSALGTVMLDSYKQMHDLAKELKPINERAKKIYKISKKEKMNKIV